VKRRHLAAILAGLALAAPDSVARAAPASPSAAAGIAFCDRGQHRPARIAVPEWVRALAEPIAREHGLDPDLVLAVIAVESAFNARAVSPKNAQGLMQLIPATAKRFGVDDPFNPAENVRGGVSYLRWLSDRFAGNTSLALAGYNAGEGAVQNHGGIPPYAETQHYVQKVARQYVCHAEDRQVRLKRWQGFAEAMPMPAVATRPRVTAGRDRSAPARPVRIRVSAQTAAHAAVGNLRCARRAELQSGFRVCHFE
jgi:hypothetical protein